MSRKVLKQRAIILGGGGALGAYQVGVLKILCKKLIQEDKKKGMNNKLLFDVIAGTSIGAMNGAVLISQYLKTRNWQDAVDQLEQFWTNKKKGLASTLSEQDLKGVDGWDKWLEESKKKPLGIASVEAARRYYSVKYYYFNGTPKVQEPLKPRSDLKFFDDKLNTWFIHKSDQLKKTIRNFARPRIATRHEKNQPRLLIFAVDAAEGETVTFDSYPKADHHRKSEYGKYTKKKGYQNVIKYDNGISIDHIMASGTLPEFYDYKEIDGHKLWDGGMLSNTPLRELLQAHQRYWLDVVPKTKKDHDISVPDLEIYIVNLHPSKQYDLPPDHDGVKDRQNDIIFGDRSSQHEERLAYLVSDLRDFVTQMTDLSTEAISKVSKESDKLKLKKKFENLIATTAASKDFKGQPCTYDVLAKGQYKLTKVVRFERTNYINAIFGKTGDFTAKTINELIEEGTNDANNVSLI